VGLAAALLAAGCSGDSDHSTVDPEQLSVIVATEPIAGTRLREEVFDDKDQLWEGVRDTDYTKGWKGGYRLQYVSVEGGIERVELTIDVYKNETAAQKRASAEQRLVDDFLKQRLSPSVEVSQLEGSVGGDACAGLSIRHDQIVPQFEVYCRSGTAVVFAKAVSANEDSAIDLATRLANEIGEAISAAALLDEPDS
jgi:hypothetical protein